MDIGDEGVADPSAEFGDLFEGQTVAFESELGGHADDVLGVIGHGHNVRGHPIHHHRVSSHHPSDHEILSTNMSFGSDEYLQHQQIVIDGDSSEYMVTVPDANLQLRGENEGPPDSVQQIYVHSNHEQMDGVVGTSISSAVQMYNYETFTQSAATVLITSPSTRTNEGTKIKEKVKRVKNVEYFTNENMKMYLKRRGFCRGGSDASRKSISKSVFALSADTQLSNGHPKIVSFGSRFEPSCVVQEMERFWRFYLWTKSKNLLVSVELLPMLIPMLLHFYFQMMLSKMLPIARRMYVEFSKKFMLEDKTQEHYDILVALMKISSPEIFKTDSSFKLLINRRYEFVLSEITIVYLRRFLSNSNHPIFVDLFTDRFKIRNRESKELIESIDWETLMDSEGAEPEANIDDDCDSVLSDASYKEHKSHVRIVIDELRNSSIANLPAISVYTTCDEPICGAVSKEGTLMAYGLAEAGIRIFAVDQAQDVLKPSENAEAELDVDDVKYACGHDGTVYGLHFHPKTKLLFSVGEDSLMRAWDLNTESPHCRAVYRGHTGPVWKLDIAKSGSIVATAGLDTTARIFVPERNEFVRMMVGHYFSVNCVKIHPNDTYLATGSADKSVRLWSINDGNISRILTGVAGTVHAIAFHSSGKYLAGAGEGCKIVIWDLAEGEAVATLESLPNCKDLTFNGSMLTAGYRNGMLQIYNLIPLLGGSNVREFNTPPSISPPYTCPTFAETVFKCYYKNPGMLFCMGSDLKVENQERRKIQQEVCINPCNETDTGATHLHKVLQNKSTNNDDGVGSDTADSKFSSSSMGTIGSGRILAARLSQPLLSSAADEIGPVIESTNGNKTGLSTDPPSSRYRSSLDEAISSVIDQASESCIGSGTITMYASN